MLAVRDLGLRIAAASSSKNAGLMLGQIGSTRSPKSRASTTTSCRPDLRLLDLLDVDISGRDFARGKPDPEIFLTAAAELGLPSRQCFVVEDAVAGVQAARAGGMAALGVARADDVELLTPSGADLVVTTLDDVALEGLEQGRLARRST